MMEADLPHILERRNSDNENQNPNPIIQTRKLSEYKVILAPKQVIPPTQRQIRDAGRCRRAGMVPGAIRKYLLQKKKNETTDEEEEGEDQEQDLDSVSEEEEDQDAEEESQPDLDVSPSERHRRCRRHCCEAKTNQNQDQQSDRGQCHSRNVVEEGEEDDEVAIVGEYRNPQNQVLGEVNCDLGGAQVNGSAAASSDSDFCPDDNSEERPESNNNNDTTNKRRYSDAFPAVSPDTTTPDVTNIPQAPATPTPSTSRSRMSPHLEIESSPVVIEFEVSPKAKKGRLETTPYPKQGKKRGSSSSLSTAEGGGGTSSDATDYEPRVGPCRKSRKARAVGEDADPNSPSSKQNCVRKIFQPDVVRYFQVPDDPELEKKVRKNVWKDVISTFDSNLEKNLVPSPTHVGDLIKKAILGLGTRVAKDIPASAMDFFGKLVQKYPVSGGAETTEYYSAAFTQTSTDDPCTMSEFLFDVLGRVQADAQACVQSKPLPFFKLLTKMVVQQYKEYEGLHVKLKQPFFVQFLEEHHKKLSYNFFCKKLVHFTFLLKNYQDEFKSVMRWVGLLAYHLKKHSALEDEFGALVDDFVEILAKPEYSPKTICEVVEAICDPALGSAVSFKIIVNQIQFESLSSRDGAQPQSPSDKEISAYLHSLAKSDSIAGLKSDLQERRHSHFAEAYPALPISSLVAATVNKNGRRGINKSAESPAVNLRGEAFLHKLCKKEAPFVGGSGGSNSNSTGLKLADLLRQKHFETVNPTDNFGNTPLHDAIAHGRFDAVTKFYEYCSDVDLPEELRVNLLAQNKVGDTPFHLAAISTDQSEQMSRMLIFMADKLQVKEEALKTLNHQGKMPFELAFNSGARTHLKPHALQEWNFELGDVYVNPSRRAQLQSLETKKLILFWSYWSQHYK